MQGDVINTEAKENDHFENLKHINNFQVAIIIEGIFNNTYQLVFVTSSLDGKNPIGRIALEPQFQKNHPFLKILARIVDSGFLKFLKRRHSLLFRKPVKAQSSLKNS